MIVINKPSQWYLWISGLGQLNTGLLIAVEALCQDISSELSIFTLNHSHQVVITEETTGIAWGNSEFLGSVDIFLQNFIFTFHCSSILLPEIGYIILEAKY